MQVELNLNNEVIVIPIIKYSTLLVGVESKYILIDLRLRVNGLENLRTEYSKIEKSIGREIIVDILKDIYETVTLNDLTAEDISGGYCDIILKTKASMKGR